MIAQQLQREDMHLLKHMLRNGYLAREVYEALELSNERIPCYDTTKMKGWADTLWPHQKRNY